MLAVVDSPRLTNCLTIAASDLTRSRNSRNLAAHGHASVIHPAGGPLRGWYGRDHGGTNETL